MDMNLILFMIAVLSAMAYLILTKPNSVELDVVKAGKANVYYPEKKIVKSGFPNYVYYNGEKIETSQYKKFYVHGNSMIHYQIHDGDKILVNEVIKKDQINDFPVLMLTITDVNGNDAKYKLRKFISYVDYSDGYNWGELYNKFCKKITIGKDLFVEQCKEKKKSSFLQNETKLILSETYNEITRKNEYSLHPVSTIYGRVVYAI